jgi:cytochrome c biogenesis protein CcdA
LTLIITTAIIDSINPCAIAVLIFLLGVLVSLKTSRKRIIKIGLVYIGAVFATYYLAGLGLIGIITKFNIQTEIATFAGVIVLLAGFLEIKEGLYPDGKQLLRIPEKTKPLFTNFLKKGTIPSVFIAGILVSAFELPCTGQVYLGILSMLSQENMRAQGYLYLFIYNLIFVLPLVIILLIAAWGFDIRRMDHMRKKTRMTVKFLMGFIMIILGIFLLFQNEILRVLEI